MQQQQPAAAVEPQAASGSSKFPSTIQAPYEAGGPQPVQYPVTNVNEMGQKGRKSAMSKKGKATDRLMLIPGGSGDIADNVNQPPRRSNRAKGRK
jgi:hypothetical protein